MTRIRDLCTFLGALIVACAAASPCCGENWPGFRGPTGQGVSQEKNLPLTWSLRENLAWRTLIPGIGWSSPIVWEDRVFVTSASADGTSCHLLCLDAANGSIAWDKEVFRQAESPKMAENSHAIPTPVTDGKLVYAAFNGGRIVAVDFHGRVAWEWRDEHFVSKHGLAASPILYRDMLIMPFDGNGPTDIQNIGYLTAWDGAFVAALDKRTGQEKWRGKRGLSRQAHVTPMIIEVNGRPQLVSGAGDVVQGFDPDSGQRLWTIRSTGEGVVPSIIYGQGLVFTSSGYGSPTVRAIRPDGRDDATATHIAWESRANVPLMPSFLYADGLLFCIKESGVATCLDATTGQTVWKERLSGRYGASPVLAEGRLYCLAVDGSTTVIAAGREFKQLAKNSLEGPCNASPAISGGRIFIRSQDSLFCIRKDSMAGQPADIATSAYQYRADRKAEKNSPESWLALMRYSSQPLNKPVDVSAPAVKRVLCALLWEEIRPVQKLELSWGPDARHRPAPENLVITTLDQQGTASSWWNNLSARQQTVTPAVSAVGRTFTYDLNKDTCGIVISVGGGRTAADFDVPAVRALVADTWKQMDIEIEWGYGPSTADKDYSGRIETYDGRLIHLAPIDGDTATAATDRSSWRSAAKGGPRRGLKASLLYLGSSKWRRVQPFTSQRDDVARTIVTLWTKAGNFSFLAADLENGPILAPEYGFFVRRTGGPAQKKSPASAPSIPSEPPFDLASRAATAREFIAELQARKLGTIRQKIRARPEQTWEGAVTEMCGDRLPPHPKPPAGSEPTMQVEVPSERLTAQWNLGLWHLVRHCGRNPANGRMWFNDYPYGILAAETYLVLAALDMMGSHKAAEDGFDQWVSLPMDPNSKGHHSWALPDRPNGLFSEGHGCLTHAVGPDGAGGHMDGVHAFGPGSIGWALIEHYRLTGDTRWFRASAPRIKANAEWMLRQRRLVSSIVPDGDRLWCKGLQPALQVTPDSGGMWMQFYECEAYYWVSVAHFAEALATIDPAEGARLMAEAEAYRKDLRAAVERSIALSPVVPVRDGTFHSVIPFACYARGLSTGAWGWKRDGSGSHVGPLYWETVQSAAALISPAGLLPPDDVRVQGYLDVLEDRLLLENEYVGGRCKGDWFLAGWQYQGGLERTANLHLVGDDIPCFLRSLLNGYAIDILPDSGYVFNEHAVHGPPDKIFEEAAFLERFCNLLVMEDGQRLWLARATPRAWLEQGKRIAVKNAPTHFGTTAYEIVSDVDHGKITATVELPSRNAPQEVTLRFRHPDSAPIKTVTVNGKDWSAFNKDKETISLKGLAGTITVTARY